ncbi:MAG: hypothetical protein PUJ85_04915, partial [bacterium]|nr:hypothetical protein [bacterium]
PYTGASTVLNVNRAATLTTPVDIGLAASTDNYKDGTGAVVTETVNVQKAEGVDPVTEAHTKEFADNSGLLLSKALIGGDDYVSVNVSFVIWFEGLDPVCLSNSLDVATIAANSTAETITMGFYAIESNAFAA